MTMRRSLPWLAALALAGLTGVLLAALTLAFERHGPGESSATAVALRLVMGGGACFLMALLLLEKFSIGRAERLTGPTGSTSEDVNVSPPLDSKSDGGLAPVMAGISMPLSLAASGTFKAPQPERAPQPCADLLNQAFHASPVGMAVCTADEKRFVELNEGFLKLLGRCREEVIGFTDGELGLWDNSDNRNPWPALLAGDTLAREVECRVRALTGEIRKVLCSVARLERQGCPVLLLTAYDITERVQREAHLLQTQKMEAVGQLAAGFAHDFNNILCIVQGHTSMLLTEPNLDARASASLAAISTAAEHAANLTRQLLTFSRKQIMQPKTLDLNLVIHSLTTPLLRSLGESVTLKFNFSADVPLVHADAGMMEQIVTSLAVNARGTMPRGGQFTISTGAADIDPHYARLKPEARAGSFACLTVSDTGCGMEPSALSRIFEPFFSTKEVGKGTGLGLATVYGIVKQHNGWIEVASQPGQGTTFKILLPASPAATEALSETTAASPIVGGREKLLVVEDEPGLLLLVQGILQRYGYQVLSAANGVEAIKVWEQQQGRIDLLVTDMVMPEGVTGRELADQLRSRNPALKVIYTSGYSMDLLGNEMGQLEEGVNFLQKPYRPQNLAQAVRNCLDGRATEFRTALAASVA